MKRFHDACRSARSMSIHCLSPFRPPTTRLSAHPLLFFSTSTDCPSTFRLPTARCLFVCLSICLSSLIFTADCQSPFRPPAVCLFADCPSPFLTADCPPVCPVLFFSTSTHPHLERQHTQQHRRPDAVDCTRTELAVRLMTHTPPPHMPPHVDAMLTSHHR